MAFQSPPARRNIARQGHPKKISAPIMANMPRMKRTTGADPVRARNSRNTRAAKNDPRQKAGISGLRYCTIPARCRPKAPAMSRVKHAEFLQQNRQGAQHQADDDDPEP